MPLRSSLERLCSRIAGCPLACGHCQLASSFLQVSDRMCVLKIKPPLCVDIAAADFFADTLDRVLTEGW